MLSMISQMFSSARQCRFSPRRPEQSRARLSAVLLVASALFAPSNSEADPLVVTGGGYRPDFEGHLYQVVGEGFDLRQGELLFFPVVTMDLCAPCFAGDMLDFSARFDGTAGFGSGSGTIAGTTYPVLTYQGWFDFRADPIVFPAAEREVLLSAPFMFTGSLRAFVEGREVFAHSLIGRGSANALYYGNSEMGMFPEDTDPGYRFDPVPEPATLLLVTSGALGITARVRWRRRRT